MSSSAQEKSGRLVQALSEIQAENVKTTSEDDKLQEAVGRILYDFGYGEKALIYHKTSLSIRLRVLGETNLFVAVSYHEMARCNLAQGALDEALDNFQKSLSVRLVNVKEQNPDVATTYIGIGAVYYCKSDLDKSIEYFQKSTDISVIVVKGWSQG